MDNYLPQEKIQQAIDLLVEQYQPAAVLLYGSRAKGQDDLHSDIDLAMLLNKKSPPDGFKLAKSQTDIEAILKKDVDLVVLDNVSPILAMEIIRNHQMLYQVDSGVINAFIMKATGEYFDLKYSRRCIEEQLLAS